MYCIHRIADGNPNLHLKRLIHDQLGIVVFCKICSKGIYKPQVLLRYFREILKLRQRRSEYAKIILYGLQTEIRGKMILHIIIGCDENCDGKGLQFFLRII